MTAVDRAQVLVIGSGAGGAVTGLELAGAGADVLLLEEGDRHETCEYGRPAPEAMRTLYRRRGMTPIIGTVPIGYVEGRCLGGSTEINSGFWHRTPPEILLRWKAQFDLADAAPSELERHFEWAEQQLSVGLYHAAWPPATQRMHDGIERMGWSAMEVPRVVAACECRQPCASGCSTGAKQTMSRAILPKAEAAGVRIATGTRVTRLIIENRRIRGAHVVQRRNDGSETSGRIEAEYVFVCCGPTETPALLRRSGIRDHVGATLTIHPMLKIAARFPEPVYADRTPIPLLQVKEFWPEITLGGSFFSAGHLAMHLSENWPALGDRMRDRDRIALFHVAVRGTGRGSVTTGWLGADSTDIRYELSDEDVRNLSRATARLSALLLEAGADEVYPGVHGLPTISSATESIRWLDERLPRRSLSLTTVHAFSTCPMGQRRSRTAADSYGKVHGYENLYINDASMLPDSPGVNPQGSVMGFARRNALCFAATLR